MISYPNTGPFPARTEPKAETPAQPITIIALCDGSIMRPKPGDWESVMHANALAADRLVERIAKRAVEMRLEAAYRAPEVVLTDEDIIPAYQDQPNRIKARIVSLKAEVAENHRAILHSMGQNIDIYAWDASAEDPPKPGLD